MKSVSFSEIVYANDLMRWPHPGQGWRRLLSFTLLMALGLATLVALLHLAYPAAPLAYIVVPVVAGGLMPVYFLMPARFEVTTRFEARHLVINLEEGLARFGYEKVGSHPGVMRYRPRALLMRWHLKDIAVAVRPHAIDITGPALTLRALQKALAR